MNSWILNTNQIIEYILKKEIEEGYIVKDKKQPQEEKLSPPSQPKPAQQAKEAIMAPGRVVVRTTTNPKANGSAGPAQAPRKVQPKTVAAAPAPAPAAGPKRGPGRPPAAAVAAPAASGKVSAPPQRRVVNGVPGRGPGRPAGSPNKVTPKAAPAAEAQGSQEAGGLGPVLESVEGLKGEVAELKAQVTELKDSLITAVTSLHDMLVQTGGTMQFPTTDESGEVIGDENGNPILAPLPELTAHPDKILAWAKGTAWDGYDASAGQGNGADHSEDAGEGEGEGEAVEE